MKLLNQSYSKFLFLLITCWLSESTESAPRTEDGGRVHTKLLLGARQLSTIATQEGHVITIRPSTYNINYIQLEFYWVMTKFARDGNF